MFGNLRQGDDPWHRQEKPYDTHGGSDRYPPVQRVSLAEYGVTYKQVVLKEDGTLDHDDRAAINEKHVLVEIQRSKGYQTRPSYSVKQIGELDRIQVKGIKPDVICMVWTTATVSLTTQWSQVMSEQM